MPDCGGTSCSCSIKVGAGLSISGAGSLESPFQIGLSGDIQDSLIIEDSPTVDLVLNGGGSPTDPYRLRAQATVRVVDLVDVVDPEGAPSAGDSLIWVTNGVDEPRWEFRPPPANPAGSVNVSEGLEGLGTLGDPLALALLDSGVDSTGGLEVYVDTAGNLRAVNPGVASVDWGSIDDKPTFFPTNSANFDGVLAANKGGTGSNTLSTITVGNASKVGGRTIHVQSSTPTGAASGDLWFW